MTLYPYNPYVPGSQTDIYTPDRLLAGPKQPITMNINVAAGQVLYRGAVMGRVTGAAVTDTFAGTGNGTITGMAVGGRSLPGAYVLTATSPTSFNVVDPLGAIRAPATVGVPYVSEVIGFEINAGGTAFAVGDAFTVTVASTAGEYLLSASAASDGSQNPVGILVENIDTSATGFNAATANALYIEAEVNANSLTFGTGYDAASVRDALAIRGVHIKFSVSGAPISY
jgi:hypothetical protein